MLIVLLAYNFCDFYPLQLLSSTAGSSPEVARLYAARRGRSIRQLFLVRHGGGLGHPCARARLRFREMDANGDGDMDSQEFSLFFLSVDREILEEAL